jgi:hypothetical protein
MITDITLSWSITELYSELDIHTINFGTVSYITSNHTIMLQTYILADANLTTVAYFT